MLHRFIDFETAEGIGDGGGIPADPGPAAEAGADPAPAAPAPADAAAAGAPSSGEPEAPAWAVNEDDWRQTTETLAELRAQNEQLVQYLQQREAATTADQAPSDEQLYQVIENARLEGDVASEMWAVQEIQRRAFGPGLDAAANMQAEQTARGWLTELQIPESDWEDVSLLGMGFRSAAGMEGRQAAQVAHQRLQERDQRVRADERQKVLQEQQAEQERLRNLAAAPSTPTGPAGVESAWREDEDEVAGFRRWKERQRAGAGGA